MACDILVDLTPPVSFGETVADPPPPFECHALFELPLAVVKFSLLTKESG